MKPASKEETSTPRKKTAANFALLAASVLIGILCAEVLLRIGINLGIGGLRDPRLYAGWCDDDDLWKLRYRWSEKPEGLWNGLLVFDPDLGWTLGDDAAGACSDCESPVLLYGGSFMNGVAPTPRNQRIPKLLSRSLRRPPRRIEGGQRQGRPVVNYAVNGYGLDQIYLRFRETHRDYTKPTIVVGIMMLNLDRSVLSVRDAPKPYFRLAGGELELHGVPLPRDSAAWYRGHPPRIRSFLLAALVRQYRLGQAPIETEIPYRRAEKEAVTVAILEAMAREVETHDLSLFVVLVYPPWQLGYEGWREPLLKAHLQRLGVPYIDTKRPLLKASAEPAAELYHPEPNFHPNAAGNRVIVREIAKRLLRWEARARRPVATPSSHGP